MGTTPELGLPYPADTDYVANGYLDIENLATAVDDLYGPSQSYTPTLTNITGGTAGGWYKLNGRWLDFFVAVTAGNTSAAGTFGIELPITGTSAGYTQLVNAMKGAGVVSAYISANSNEVTCTAHVDGSNFTNNENVATYRVQGRIEVEP